MDLRLQHPRLVGAGLRQQRAGALRIAVLPAIAQWLAPRVTQAFLQPRPSVRVLLDSLPSRQIAELVATHQYDMGVVEMPVLQTSLEVDLIEGIESVVSRVAAASWTFAPSTLAIRRLKERVTTDVALVFPVIGTRSKLVESYAREMRAEIRRLLRGPTAAA